ncbi:MAG TPA: response regulator [Candidatus Limnocylindria bacterium]|jgi:two-component system LytT family response regulator|nr:response regulator [Candidatus Limnocylindria bacterium]
MKGALSEPIPVRVLIVDDEPVARHRLKRLLRKVGDITIIAECGSGAAAVSAIRENELDLVFLDVQMPEMGGFEVVRHVGPERMPPIIFVTAFDRFALQAFESEALDYLLKPFGEDRVRKALARARTFLQGSAKRVWKSQLNGLMKATANPVNNCLLVKDRDRVLVLRPHEIDWVEADADYVRLHVGPESHLIRSTLASMEERLAGDGFLRIHRSRLVNLERIKELRPAVQGESVVVLKSGGKLGASQDGLKLLHERFTSLG